MQSEEQFDQQVVEGTAVLDDQHQRCQPTLGHDRGRANVIGVKLPEH